ncbi:hypothetical protein POTOM_047706 [Populus tomentosa]|uniref:Uncharacterized protein n=1 Tax=Populus tomentosa TaxID=118781 RepID=A0A8X8CB33_POPTO|nr:hypothetical protein POTOM_047706 [Populus tomentosa]
MAVVENETAKPHVAIMPSVGVGHITPLLEIAKRLVVLHDFHVSFIVIATNEASAGQDNLLQASTLPPGLEVVCLPTVDVFAVTTNGMPVAARLCAIVQEAIKSLKSVLVELGKIKAVVVDLFCTQAFDICSELSIPAYLFFTASIALLNFSLYLPTLDREVEGEFVDLPEPVKVPGCPPIRPEDLLDQVKNRKIDEYKWYLFHSSRFHMGAGIFLNSWEGLEPANFKAITEDPFFKQIHTPPVHPVGPLIKLEEPLTASDADCLAWLDKQPPNSVLFVSLGSGGTLTAEQLTELAWGLELSHQRFIFVVRMPANSSASAAFFNAGSDVNDPKTYLPTGFLERTQERGLVVPSWAPQLRWRKSLDYLSVGLPASPALDLSGEEEERGLETMISEIEATKPHVAVVSVPLMGHIIPLLEFAKRLVVDHDFHVSFLVITTNEASAAQDQLLQSPTFPPGLDFVYLPPIDMFSVTTDDMLMLTRLCVMVEESLKSLKSVLKELGELRAVVIDKFFTQALDVCCELSIPAYLFYTSAIVMLTFSLSLPTLDCEVEGEFVDLAEPLKVPGCPPFPIEDLFDPLKNRKIDEYKWLLFHSSRFHLAAGIFVNSWKELESVTYKAITEDPFFKQIPTPPVLPVGPLIKGEPPLTARDIECLAWLDKQPSDSVLFVALGSGGTLTADQLTELAWGLELSHQRFIFVVRKPTNSSASAAVFTAGSDVGNPMTYLPEGALEIGGSSHDALERMAKEWNAESNV